MATGSSDCVEDDGDADRLALTLSALRIVHDVNTVQISEANLRLRSENEYSVPVSTIVRVLRIWSLRILPILDG